jgi:sortase A
MEPNTTTSGLTDVNDTASEDNTISNELSKDNAITAIYDVRPETGEEVGELYIPKLDATLTIYEGTNEDELDKGVGHYADSVLPGENDNSVLSGHRDTVFRKLGEVGEGDSLIVTTSAGEFEYKVDKVRIVDKDDRTVIVPKPRATLTVSTCYPFTYIGPAPQRYILVAYLTSATLN